MQDSGDYLYREELRMPRIAAWLLLASLVVTPVFIYLAYRALPVDSTIRSYIATSPNGPAIAFTVIAVFILPELWMIHIIRTRAAVLRLSEDGVYLGATLMHTRPRVIPFSAIVSCRVLESRPPYQELQRLASDGRLWTLGNASLVELGMDDGSRFLIGTHRPDELVGAIWSRVSSSPFDSAQ